MVIKVKVSDVAKDFGKSNKEIIELLGDYCDGPAKKASTVLEENELNILFDKLTQQNSVKSLNDYLMQERLKESRKLRRILLRIIRLSLKSRLKKPKSPLPPRIKNVRARQLFCRWRSRRLSVQRKRQRKSLSSLRRQEQRAKHAESILV